MLGNRTHERLSSLDASFLEVETPTAHMHVGWVALFRPREGAERPSFNKLRAFVAARLGRAPRYRQKLAFVPLGLHDPVWIDDREFDVSHHVQHSTARDIDHLVERVFSKQLRRDRPLWELWIADELEDGRIGVVGKAHHCMVDGIAAVELSSLFLDPDAVAAPPEPDTWIPEPGPSTRALVTVALADLV